MNTPIMTKILSVTQETHNIKTISFHHSSKMTPGQFFMVWIPGVDEIPMSVSQINDDIKAITFKKIGDATTALFEKRKDDSIGIRGPFGNGFSFKGKKQLFVGGGTGIAMLRPAIKEQFKEKKEITAILGFQSKQDLFFTEEIKQYVNHLYITTDDGSESYKGYASTLATDLINKKTYDIIYTCGPEPMMKSLLNHRKSIPIQASLERYMKCGFGLCGQCCIGNGQRVCMDGPVFSEDILEKDEEFGSYKRNETGTRIPI